VLTELVGWTAVVLTQIFWIPNILRILRTRDVAGYSLFAWVLMVGGLSCWLIYFISKGDTVGIAANIFGVTGSGITTLCIYRWRKPATDVKLHEAPLPLPSESGTS
jgi:MtN3 and saliva related transmembrane protein